MQPATIWYRCSSLALPVGRQSYLICFLHMHFQGLTHGKTTFSATLGGSSYQKLCRGNLKHTKNGVIFARFDCHSPSGLKCHWHREIEPIVKWTVRRRPSCAGISCFSIYKYSYSINIVKNASFMTIFEWILAKLHIQWAVRLAHTLLSLMLPIPVT